MSDSRRREDENYYEGEKRRRESPQFYDKEVVQFGKGLYTDSSPQIQPQGTLRFALNCVDETEEGDMLFPSNMESNMEDSSLPEGFIPIGKVYIGKGETVLFLTTLEGDSEIGIYNDKTGYSTQLNEPSLNFKITHQIDAVYRLRRGCDKTIYWTDNLNPIRQYIFNRKEDYLINGVFNIELTNLFKKWRSLPEIKNISIGENGSLKAGSYNFALQYLDSDLNPTEWILTTETVNIYHSNLSLPYRELEGSSSEKKEFQTWGESTGKSIHLSVDNLDTNFNFYRIGIIEATSGSGYVSKVTASAPISTEINEYIFTGDAETVITVEEIAQFSTSIETAQSIEQIENKLLLGNTKGKQINYCELQQYASNIISNYVIDKVLVDRIEDKEGYSEELNSIIAGSKDPIANTKKLGYMPGEIYSFGIVYYFKDGTSSPVYHIPGKSDNDLGRFSNMSTDNNISSKYTTSSNCDGQESYWGSDYTGEKLEGNSIRHHRFPTRAEAQIKFIEKVNTEEITGEVIGQGYALVATITYDISSVTGLRYYFLLVKGTLGDKRIKEESTFTLLPNDFGKLDFEIDTIIADTEPDFNIESYSWYSLIPPNTTITFKLVPKTVTQITTGEKGFQANIFGIEFSNIEVPQLEGDNEIIGYRIVRNSREEINKTILDSGVLLPISEYENFLGYGHSAPNLTEDANFNLRNDIYAFINPEFLFNKKEYTQSNIQFINAGEYAKFSSFNYNSSYTNGFNVGDRVIENFIEDAYPGTTYDPSYHKGKEKDTDGLTLHTVTKYRDTELIETTAIGGDLFRGIKVKNIFYLNALSSNSIFTDNTNKDVFNISSDNRIGVVQLWGNTTSPFSIEGIEEKLFVPKIITRNTPNGDVSDFADVLENVDGISSPILNTDYYTLKMNPFFSNPYFYMKRNLANPYSNFRYLPYYTEHIDIVPISQTKVKVFNGDVYISPMTYNNSMFHDIKPKKRKTKSQTWKFIAGGLLILGGIAGAIFTGGASLTLVGAGLGLVGAATGLSIINSGIEGNKIINIYEDEYEKGLKHISRDGTTKQLFVDNKTAVAASIVDDEIQWYNDVINGLWFESQVNIGVRQGNTAGVTSFIPSPFEFSPTTTHFSQNLKLLNYSNNYFRRRAIEKVSVLDPESDGGRLYIGHANAEIYDINKDLQRRNREKPYFSLGLEYDCCSDCVETFPHRIHYSEQSFQEELTDNFRVFLPNNYIDIDGETGEVTNIFKIQNELFIHTEEAVWKMPKNYQERITDEIVSFIGTGSYFSIPPQKLIDSESGNSFGTKHKWSRLKTTVGYFFVSESQNAICMFDGNQIKEISKLGTYYWFYNNIPLLSNTENRDNPSNPEGIGFICAYDSKKELVFVTKKDRFPTGEDNSWTMSFNLKKNSWGSWHSFMPNFYFQTSREYYSYLLGKDNIWKHNVRGHYQTYYGDTYPYIIEYVLTNNPLQNKTFEDIMVFSESKKYDTLSKTFYDVDNIFFDKLLVYNSRQCSGILNIVVKDKEDMNFFMNQVSNNDLQNITADRNERNWTINELRDMVVTKNTPIFISDTKELQDNYFIDKELNPAVIDYNKDWTQIESFRDKYLVVRFIFDKFVDIKLITNFSANTENNSIR